MVSLVECGIKSVEAWQWALGDFGWDASQWSELRIAKGSKHLRVFAEQEIQGWPVLGSKVQAKFHDASLVFVSSDWWPELDVVAMSNGISQETIIDALFEEMAVNGSSGNAGTTFVTDFGWEDLGMAWLPVMVNRQLFVYLTSKSLIQRWICYEKTYF